MDQGHSQEFSRPGTYKFQKPFPPNPFKAQFFFAVSLLKVTLGCSVFPVYELPKVVKFLRIFLVHQLKNLNRSLLTFVYHVLFDVCLI